MKANVFFAIAFAVVVAVTITLGLVADAQADPVGVRVRSPAFATATNTLDEASTTVTVNLQKAKASWGLAVIYVTVTDASDGVTDISMACTTSEDGGTTPFYLSSCDVSAGACTSSLASWSYDPQAVTSPKRWVWRVDIEGLKDLACEFSDTGGDVSDVLAVSVSLAAK